MSDQPDLIDIQDSSSNLASEVNKVQNVTGIQEGFDILTTLNRLEAKLDGIATRLLAS
jgi:hypothetical protein